MQFRKPYMTSASRTSTYASSLIKKSPPRKKVASTQTEKSSSPFDEWFEARLVSKDELTFNEDATKTYSKALEYVNSFHSYLNKKLSEKYCDCGDTKPEGSNFFKVPEVPNYVAVFLMLLEKSNEPALVSNKGNASNKPEVEPKKYTTDESVIEFVPDIKKLPEYQTLERNGALEEMKTTEQEVQTVISGVKDEGSISCTSKTLSDDLSSFSSKKSNNVKSTSSVEVDSLEKDKNLEQNGGNDETKIEEIILINQGKDKGW